MRNNRYKGGFPVDKLDGRSGVFTADDIDALKRKSLSTWPAPNQNDTSQTVWPSGPDRDPYYSQVVWHLTDAIEEQPAGAMHDHSGKNHEAHYIKPRNDWPYGSPFHAGPKHFHSTYFNDQCYRVTDTASLRLGTTAFTIEFWACLHRNDATEHYIIGKGGQAGRTSGTGWVVYLTSTYILGYYDAVGNVSIQGASALNRDQWYHIAIVRTSTSSNDTRIYVDGALYATGTSSGNFTDTNTLYIGRDRVDTASSAYYGKLTDIRISSGAVYTAAFTRPSTPRRPLWISRILFVISVSSLQIHDFGIGSSSISGKLIIKSGICLIKASNITRPSPSHLDVIRSNGLSGKFSHTAVLNP